MKFLSVKCNVNVNLNGRLELEEAFWTSFGPNENYGRHRNALTRQIGSDI